MATALPVCRRSAVVADAPLSGDSLQAPITPLILSAVGGADLYAASGPMRGAYVVRGLALSGSFQGAGVAASTAFAFRLAQQAGATQPIFDSGTPLFAQLGAEQSFNVSGSFTVSGLWVPVLEVPHYVVMHAVSSQATLAATAVLLVTWMGDLE